MNCLLCLDKGHFITGDYKMTEQRTKQISNMFQKGEKIAESHLIKKLKVKPEEIVYLLDRNLIEVSGKTTANGAYKSELQYSKK